MLMISWSCAPVLKEEISEGAKTDVVDRAVEQAGELEKRLTQSTELLDEVNDTLEQAAQGVDSASAGSADLSAPRKHAPHFLSEKDGGLK